MSLCALKAMLHSRRFWIWQLAGAAIYATPVAIRLATGNVVLPILGLLETPWIDHFVPANLVEKVLVNGFFPGAAGAVAGEIYFTTKNANRAISRRRRYGYRLAGALFYVTLFSAFQCFGYFANIIASYGSNLFEFPGVYPLNFLLASLSIFTPTIIGYLANKVQCASHKIRAKPVKS
ncbi:hypothetical protein GX563_11620 [Candidatus Bathyarchaeota archaeon]|nr:hypothetical protein [Candidatus Bathyarchaeota archaeon]